VAKKSISRLKMLNFQEPLDLNSSRPSVENLCSSTTRKKPAHQTWALDNPDSIQGLDRNISLDGWISGYTRITHTKKSKCLLMRLAYPAESVWIDTRESIHGLSGCIHTRAQVCSAHKVEMHPALRWISKGEPGLVNLFGAIS
jgi:hypothetical protein